MANTSSNSIVKPNAKRGLDNMKTEIANELGITNYDSMDKGNLPSRQNGYVGGYMVRRMIEMAEQQLSGR